MDKLNAALSEKSNSDDVNTLKNEVLALQNEVDKKSNQDITTTLTAAPITKQVEPTILELRERDKVLQCSCLWAFRTA